MAQTEYQKQWREKNKERIRASSKAYYQKHREEIRRKQHQRWVENKDDWKLKRHLWYQEHKAESRTRQSSRVVERKARVLTYYGKNGKCACVICGENRLACLSIDHISGDGTKHREEIRRKGFGFYNWLIQSGFPEGYQTLCMNCQFVKRAKYNESGNRRTDKSKQLELLWALR